MSMPCKRVGVCLCRALSLPSVSWPEQGSLSEVWVGLACSAWARGMEQEGHLVRF